MSSETLLVNKLLSQNLERKNFVDSFRLDIVNGREVTMEQTKEAIKYLQEDSAERGQKQAAVAKPKAKKVEAKPLDAEALMQSMFKL